MKAEITSAFSGTISSGEYENEKPLFSVKIETEIENISEISELQRSIYQICRSQYGEAQTESIVKRIERQTQNIRFRERNGKRYPSVTSIIGWDEDFHVKPAHLVQYAARGTIIHKQVEIYNNTNEWREPKDIPEIYPELVILKQGDLQLSYNDVDFRGFLEKYPIEVNHSEIEVFNEEYFYAGKYDFTGIPKGWDGVREVLTLFDIKTASADEAKAMKQLTAYWHCLPDIQQICVIRLNNKTKQGFSKPKVETDKNKYWSLFLKDRENFKKRFLI